METTVGQRLQMAIKARKITPYVVAKETGISASTISRIISGKVDPNASTIQSICTYLVMNYDWVMTGKGFMTNNFEQNEGEDFAIKPEKLTNYKPNDELIPAYTVDFIAGNSFEAVEDHKIQPDFYMDFPDFRGCTAFKAYSDSMEGLIKSGSWLFGTKVERWNEFLEFGQIYGIVCQDGRKFLKYIKKFKEDPKEYFLLVSENDFYEDFEMPKVFIRSIWLIHGHVTKRL